MSLKDLLIGLVLCSKCGLKVSLVSVRWEEHLSALRVTLRPDPAWFISLNTHNSLIFFSCQPGWVSEKCVPRWNSLWWDIASSPPFDKDTSPGMRMDCQAERRSKSWNPDCSTSPSSCISTFSLKVRFSLQWGEVSALCELLASVFRLLLHT